MDPHGADDFDDILLDFARANGFVASNDLSKAEMVRDYMRRFDISEAEADRKVTEAIYERVADHFDRIFGREKP